jgi:hypothetical protein
MAQNEQQPETRISFDIGRPNGDKSAYCVWVGNRLIESGTFKTPEYKKELDSIIVGVAEKFNVPIDKIIRS